MFDRHDFAAEQHLPNGGRHAVTEAVHDRDKAHGADRPDQNCDLVVGQIVHELRRLAEIGAGNDLHLRTRIERGVQVFDRDVEIERSLIAENVTFPYAENTGKLRDEVQHRAVADRDTLGHAGAAAGEIDVQRVYIHRLCAPGG